MFNLEKRYTVFIYYHVPCLAVGISKIGNSERYLGDCFFIILLKRQSFIYLYIYTYIYIYRINSNFSSKELYTKRLVI